MKKKITILPFIIVIFAIGGCSPKQSIPIEGTFKEDAPLDTEDAENINTTDTAIIEQIKDFLLSEHTFASVNAVKGAATRLNKAGCAEVTEVQTIDDDGEVYTIELTDSNNNTFCFTIDHQGYIGPITNKSGDYLYTPMD